MSLYTGTGDHGETGLFGNRRVPKDDSRIEAYGAVDELNSVLGLLRAEALEPEFDQRIGEIQACLFEAGADLATEGGRASLPALERLVPRIEGWIDESEAALPRLSTFVLPGGHREAALLHVARTVARRAERRYWTLARRPGAAVPEIIGVFLNRLSDLFFSWARLRNLRHGRPETPWTRNGGSRS
ncbi:MAG: cob(I)yrinic acid a,c-diamide adenosyltransferase [Planctomycetota bacterium]